MSSAPAPRLPAVLPIDKSVAPVMNEYNDPPVIPTLRMLAYVSASSADNRENVFRR